MQVDVRAGVAECDHESNSAWRRSRLNKFALAGATMVTAGALAVTPVTVTPTTTLSDPQVASMVDLSAFENPLTLWVTTISNTLVSTGGLGLNFVEQVTELGQTLGNPDLQREFVGSVFGTLSDPANILRQTFGFPAEYGARILAAFEASSESSEDAFSKLPAALSISIGHLLRGEFLLAFSEINHWFLTDGLSDGRGSLLDALRIPGDFLESIGLDPFARILGTSWMDEGTNGPGFGPGLLSRGVIGNFGRALLAPAVTAIFQTVELLDDAREALFSGDLVTLASTIINAPAKIVNAFLNGYVPDFVTDPDSPIPPGPGQTFPGLLSPTGTFDFFFVQIPQQIARALKMEKPVAAPEAAAARIALAESSSPADGTLGSKGDAITLDLVSSTTGATPEGGEPAATVTDEADTAEEVTDVDAVEDVTEVDEPQEAVADEDTATADESDTSASAGGDSGKSNSGNNRERRNGGDRSAR